MPPLPLSLPLLCSLLAVTLLPSSTAAKASRPHDPCLPRPFPTLCGLFDSPPPFPFGLGHGCGHPDFQIRCSANLSLVTINNSTFYILGRTPTNLLLSPLDPHTRLGRPCSADLSPLPTREIAFAGTPFSISDDSCYNLSSLPAVSPVSTCRACANLSVWQRRLVYDPISLLKECRRRGLTSHGHGGQSSCDAVVASIVRFLQSGIRVQWDLSNDTYSVKCHSCQNTTRHGDHASCGFNASDPSKPFLCLRPPPPPLPSHHQVSYVVLLCATLFALACFFALAVSATIAFRRNSALRIEEDPTTAFLRRHHLQLRSPVFTYDQLRDATAGFDPKRMIGDGGFGSVYLAQLADGRAAAVKRLHCHGRHHSATTKSFCNEILILSSIHHPNLVRLHGYCCDPRGLLLVYDYIPNGTLADHLHGSRGLYRKAALTWPLRVEVALQIAIALEYLHFSVKPPVVHRDITSSNIFVERDMRIKVGDFGLSRLLSLPPADSSNAGSSSSEYVCTGPQGTPGYLDPDYHRSFRLTEKSDVYSFGVVLLELLTGLKAVDMRREKREVGLADMVVSKIQVGELHDVIDPVLLRHGQGMVGTVEAAAELAFRCLAGDKDDRPDARELVEELRRIRGRMQDASSKAASS